MAVAITPIAWWKMFPFPSLSSTDFTVCGWCRPDRVPGAGDTNVVWQMDNFSGGGFTQIAFGEDSGSARLEAWQDDAGGPRVTGATHTTGEWIFAALTCSGSDLDLYWRLEEETSLSTAAGTIGGSVSISEMLFGSDRSFTDAQCFQGAYRYWRYFDGTALSSSAVLDESASTTAVATEYGDWPIENTSNDTDDVSGGSHTLEWNTGVGGAQSNTDDPTIELGPAPSVPDLHVVTTNLRLA